MTVLEEVVGDVCADDPAQKEMFLSLFGGLFDRCETKEMLMMTMQEVGGQLGIKKSELEGTVFQSNK